MREVLNAIFYLNRSGCQWDMLPHDLPAKSTVYDHFAQWKADGTWQRILDALRQQVRVAGGHDPSPSRRRASTARRSRRPRSPTARGYDGGKKITGRKRHIIVDKLGLLLVVAVSVASADDGTYRPRGAGPADRRASDPAGGGLGRREVPQPLTSTAGWRDGGRVCDRGGRSAGWVGGVREAAEAVGGGADASPGWADTGGTAGTTSGTPSRARR